MKAEFATRRQGSRTSEMAGAVSAGRLLLLLLRRLLWTTVLTLPVFAAHAGAVFTNLYSFTNGMDGAYPFAGLVQGSDGNFYGTTFELNPNSGEFEGNGTVFKISTNGALTTLHAFGALTNASGAALDGANPNGLTQGNDGNFYGTTQNGGTNGAGTVFKINTNGTLTSLYSFTGSDDGANPQSGLLQASDGFFYGTTYGGGDENGGTVFQIASNGALANLYDFTGIEDGIGIYVSVQPSGLVQGSDGNLYGTCIFGGANEAGAVFQISTDGALTNLYSFTGSDDGGHPQSGVMQASDGLFYGVTFEGGTNGDGTVFNISTNGTLTSLYSFTGGSGGKYPSAVLLQASNGRFYGVTAAGGLGGVGTIFRLTMLPEFQTVTLSGSTLSLTWSTEVGGTYQLQFNSDLSSSNWINMSGAITATGATLSTTDFVTNGPQRFYRLVLLP
jgi:uncharacterized repeat protein (TIGR03803 family)